MKREEMDPLLKKVLRGVPPPAASTCVDAERLAAWSAGSLPEAEAAQVEHHLSDCVRCQAMLAAFARTEPPASAAVPFWKRPVGWLVPLAAAATVVVWVAVRREPAPAPVELARRASAPASTVEPAPPPQPRLETPPKFEARADKDTKKTEAPTPAGKPVAIDRVAPAQPVTPPPSPAAAPIPAPLPPPPPPAQRPPTAQGAAAAIGAANDTSRMADTIIAAAKTAESATGTVEIVVSGSAPSPSLPGGSRAAAAGRGGGGGSGTGAGRGLAGRPAPVFPSQAGPARWRILPSGKVEHSIDDGATWDAIALESPARLTGGTAPTSAICWLIGRAGVVYRADDGVHFQRVTFPIAVDLVLIRATGAAQATVTTSDGRVFTTADGGLTWVQGFPPASF